MTSRLRTLAFGELDSAGVWGAAWLGDPSQPALTALGAGACQPVVAALRLGDDDERADWRLEGDGAELVVAPAGETVAVHAAEDAIDGFDQLCRVSGRFERDGVAHAVDCLGLRSWWSDAVALERYESVRAVSLWFEPDEAMALTAFRPRKAKGHDKDVLAAAMIAGNGTAPVEDPRLSTSYGAEGWPERAGLELWLADQEPERQYPRRASGEAMGARAQTAGGGVELRAERFRWHSRGREGAGVYLLARPR
jgi:hypothetical protein